MTEAELCDLLEKMTPSTNLVDSTDDPAWFAHRKGETLRDRQLLPMLRKVIEERQKPADKEFRRNAYFLLNKLLLREMDTDFCQFLIDCLEWEKDRYVIAALLDGLGWLRFPEGIRIEPIIACSRNEKWLIRHSAIHALRASNTEESREAVRYWVRQPDEKKYKLELIYANAALGYIGVPEDIALLEQHVHSRIRDVKDSAVYAIGNIRQRMEQNIGPER